MKKPLPVGEVRSAVGGAATPRYSNPQEVQR